MVTTNMLVTGSSSTFGVLQFSGTQFTNNQSVGLTLLCALSGLAIIPIKCDKYGYIGSVAV